jgi:hypothetical protein
MCGFASHSVIRRANGKFLKGSVIIIDGSGTTHRLRHKDLRAEKYVENTVLLSNTSLTQCSCQIRYDHSATVRHVTKAVLLSDTLLMHCYCQTHH